MIQTSRSKTKMTTNFVRVFGDSSLIDQITSLHSNKAHKLLSARRFASFLERKDFLVYKTGCEPEIEIVKKEGVVRKPRYEFEIEIASKQKIKWIFDYLEQTKKQKVTLRCVENSIPDPQSDVPIEKSLDWFIYVCNLFNLSNTEPKYLKTVVVRCLERNFIIGFRWVIEHCTFEESGFCLEFPLLDQICKKWKLSEDELLSMAKWLTEKEQECLFSGPLFFSRWSKNICSSLLKKGYQKIVEWILTIDDDLNVYQIMPLAVKTQDLAFIQLLEKYSKRYFELETKNPPLDIYTAACHSGNLEWVKWAVQKCDQHTTTDRRFRNNALNYCLKHGYLDIVDFLYNGLSIPPTSIKGCMKSGKIESLEWIFKKNRSVFEQALVSTKTMVKNTLFDAFKWVIKRFPYRLMEVFRTACSMDRFDIFEFFMNNSPELPEHFFDTNIKLLIQQNMTILIDFCIRSSGYRCFTWIVKNLIKTKDSIVLVVSRLQFICRSESANVLKYDRAIEILLKTFGNEMQKEFLFERFEDDDNKTLEMAIKYQFKFNKMEALSNCIRFCASKCAKELIRSFDLREDFKSMSSAKKISTFKELTKHRRLVYTEVGFVEQPSSAFGEKGELFYWMWNLFTLDERETLTLLTSSF